MIICLVMNCCWRQRDEQVQNGMDAADNTAGEDQSTWTVNIKNRAYKVAMVVASTPTRSTYQSG
jgi:hypothetical protein